MMHMKLENFNEIIVQFGLKKVDEEVSTKNGNINEVLDFLGLENEPKSSSVPLQDMNKAKDCPMPKKRYDAKNWCVIV